MSEAYSAIVRSLENFPSFRALLLPRAVRGKSVTPVYCPDKLLGLTVPGQVNDRKRCAHDFRLNWFTGGRLSEWPLPIGDVFGIDAKLVRVIPGRYLLIK
jgi:hypothetical protein